MQENRSATQILGSWKRRAEYLPLCALPYSTYSHFGIKRFSVKKPFFPPDKHILTKKPVYFPFFSVFLETKNVPILSTPPQKHNIPLPPPPFSRPIRHNDDMEREKRKRNDGRRRRRRRRKIIRKGTHREKKTNQAINPNAHFRFPF